MTEFHQLNELYDHRVEPIADFQEPVTDTIEQNAVSQEESAIEATAEMNAFRYYYAGAGQPAYVPPLVTKRPQKMFSPRRLAGSGVIGATLISGVVIAGLPTHSTSQSPQGIAQSEVKQSPSNPVQSPVALPEVMPQSPLTSANSLQKAKEVVPKKSSGVALKQLSANRMPLQAMAQPTIAVTELPPPPTMPTVAVTVPQSLPNPLPAPPVLPVAQITPLQKAPAKSLQSSPPPPTYTSELPTLTSDQPSPPPTDTSELPTLAPDQPSPPPTDTSGLPIPTPSSVPLADPPTLPQSTADARCLSPLANVETSPTDARSLPVQSSLSVSAPETIVTAANSKAQPEKTALLKAAQTIAAQAPSLSEAEKELQTLLALPKKFPTSAGIAVLPLPCEAVQVAGTRQQMGEFAVLKLSPQDYQKRWKTSSNNSPAVTPTYGFVDYKQQAIVLVQESNN